MAKLIECVPNFSEGRNKEVIDKLVEVYLFLSFFLSFFFSPHLSLPFI